MSNLRVVVVDDDSTARPELVQLLQWCRGVEVVGDFWIADPEHVRRG